MADGPDARHTRAWAGGPSLAIPSDPSSRRVLVRPHRTTNGHNGPQLHKTRQDNVR